MSTIDEFKKVQRENSNVIKAIHLSQKRREDGTPNPNNDKGCMTFHETGNNFTRPIYIEAGYGFYGDSSWHSVSDYTSFLRYVVRAINYNSVKIASDAMHFAMEDIEKARKAAEQEALEVLQQTKA